MKKSLPAFSHPACQPVRQASECVVFDGSRPTPARQPQQLQAARRGARQSGKIHSLFAACMAFGAAVVVSLMAAVAVAGHDMPLMLGGF